MMPTNSNGSNGSNGTITPSALTVGEGKKNPQGFYRRINEPSVKAFADVLRAEPATVERWWSMHLWKDSKRSTKAWQASAGVAVDIDYCKPLPETPPPELVERLKQAVAMRELPGAIFHLTPHGARLAWVYAVPLSDRALQMKAERGAGTIVTTALEKLGLTDYKVDTAVLGDLARFFYTPNSIAKDVKRAAEVIVLEDKLTNPSDLAIFDVAVRVVEEPKKPNGVVPIATNVQQAIDNWNSRNPQTWPRNSAECPICGDTASFGTLPDDPARWFCFSSDHKSVGIPGDKGFHGDALDMEAFKRGVKIIDVLRKDGYLKRQEIDRSQDREAQERQDDDSGFGGGGAAGGGDPAEEPIGSWRSRSYLTAVGIIEQNYRDVLEGRKLELNDMSGDTELGRVPIRDAEAHRIRYLIEKKVPGGVDKNGNQVGLQLSSADVFAAINQVAAQNPYHPVRDYLAKLKWDGEQRIKTVVKLLGAVDNEINQIIIKKFFISAVARAREPGCKVDTVFILVGRQGARKSSFFRTLASPWFIDTTIDIGSDPVRAYMTMRKAWILEWAELESLFKARNASTIKAFLSSPSDSYVPKHARYSIEVKRSGIITGSINPDEFLSDDTGHRRFWPLTVGDIDLDTIAAIRDQLWAEAQALYDAKGEKDLWWLSEDEERMLGDSRSEHEVSDSWAPAVYAYVAGKPAVSIADVLGQAICLEAGRWTAREVSRVCRVLKASGEWKPDPNKVKGQPRLWLRTGGNTGGEKQQSLPGLPQSPTSPTNNT